MGASSASAPIAPHVEPEPRSWQPRSQWVNARLLCGAAAFFFAAFVFAYFYLRSLDTNKAWTIGPVHPGIGLGTAIAVVLIASSLLLQRASRQPQGAIGPATWALGLAIISVVLQVIQWTTLGFGPASGGFASVYIGWTAFYAVFTLFCAFWIETQVATAWRARREGPGFGGAELLEAGFEGCTFFWRFYVTLGLVAYVVLYLL